MTLEPFQVYTYTGILVLDNVNQQALLGQRGSDGTFSQTLMMLDNPPLGDFNPAEVTAAYQYFSTKRGVNPGDTITVVGFWNYHPDGNRPVLHVVRA